jgi:hypothetical protein
VTFLPIRYFIILALLKKFARGKTYYQRRYTGNKEALKIEIYNFMIENNYLKHHPNYYQRMRAGPQAATIYDLWIEKSWPSDKKFAQKLIDYLQIRLFIMLPKNFTEKFRVPKDLIECAGYIG